MYITVTAGCIAGAQLEADLQQVNEEKLHTHRQDLLVDLDTFSI